MSEGPQIFSCKEEGCNADVIYYPKKIKAIRPAKSPQIEHKPRKKIVYLWCENKVKKHEYPYEVNE